MIRCRNNNRQFFYHLFGKKSYERKSNFSIIDYLSRHYVIISEICNSADPIIVPERKPGFFVKIKEDENFNHRHT
jgi:hypothetical protein